MNQRERYRETVLFGKPDKVPFAPGGPRESTLKVWHQQGLPEGVNYMEALLKILGIEREVTQPQGRKVERAKKIPGYQTVRTCG